MKRNTVKLLFWIALAYGAILLVARGILPSDSTPPTSLIAIPLVVMAIIIVRDMAHRSTNPTRIVSKSIPYAHRGRQVEFLSRQIDVTAKASALYFDDLLRARLTELLVNKAVLESGLQRERVLQLLSDRRSGIKFLKNDTLYKLLYSPAPEKGRARIEMIREAVDLIEAWNA